MVMCGLWFEHIATKRRTQVPLKSIDVDVNISGFIAHVSSTLQYQNSEANPIEAVFTFPIDENSAVYKFEAEIEGRKIIAECQEKKQAKQTYDDAVAAGRTALLLEEHGEAGDIFRCTVGNLPPNTGATVRFAYVQELGLAPDGTAVQFTLPCVFVPRYRPEHSAPQKESSPALTSPESVPYTLSFSAVVTGSKVNKVVSENDKIHVDYSDAETKVTLAKEFKFEHDLNLLVQYEEAFLPTVVAQRGKAEKAGILKEDVLMLNFMPELKGSDFSTQHEFIFVIDRSGSMRGSNIQNASETLLLLLKALPTGCYFNVCSFGSRFDFLFPKSQEYSAETLKKALDLQKKLDANYGGTEILRPLQDIYKQNPIPTHTRQVLLLTDGGVSNTQEVIALVKKNSHSARMFAIGIGSGASTSLVKGIARAGNGREEFVQGTDRLQAKVMKILKQAMQGSVREVTLDWSLSPEVKVTVVPEKVSSIFSGDKLIMYAILKGAPEELFGSVSLRGKVGERPLEFELPLARATQMAESEAQPLHRLASKAQIKLLEDREVGDDGESQVDSAVFGKMNHKDLIILLSTSANIVSRHTAFVGVDKELGEQVKGPMVTRPVPVPSSSMVMMCSAPMSMKCASVQSASSGVMGSLLGSLSGASKRKKKCAPWLYERAAPAAATRSAGAPGFYSRSVDSCEDEDEKLKESWEEGDCGGAGGSERERAQRKPVRRDVLAIVSLQGFQGNWELNQSLADILGKNLDELKSSADSQDAEVWGTVLALAWLQVNFAANKDEWEMIEMKAQTWLATRDLKGHTLPQLIHKAQQLNLNI